MKDEFKILISEVKQNTTNGDIEIARMVLYFLLDRFKSLMEDDVKAIGKSLGESKKEMASIQNIAQVLIELGNSPKRLHEKLVEYKKVTETEYTDKVINRFIKTLEYPVRIITISRSSTIKRALAILSQRDLIKKIYLIRSYPGLEGNQLHHELEELGIKSTLIYLAEINRYITKCDIATSGADTITDNYIVNKIGTSLLFEHARLYKVKTIVLGNPLKHIVKDVEINNSIFEKVPIKYITKIYY